MSNVSRHTEAPMTLDDCETHFTAIRLSRDALEVRSRLRVLLDAYPVVSFELGRGSVFWRARKVGVKPHDNAADVGYPPIAATPQGRLNDLGAPSLYAATRRTTALREIGVAAGDHVQVMGFRVKPDRTLRLGAIGELFHVYKTGYIRSLGKDPENALSRILNGEGLDEGTRLIYIDAFLASLLADPNAPDKDYLASRALAALAYEDSGADGLFYPSVQDDHGMNVAIKPGQYDIATHVVCCQFIKVDRVREFGIVDFQVLQEAANVDDYGNFEWRTPGAQNITRFFGLTEREHHFLTSQPQSDGNAFLELTKLHHGDG